MRITNSMMTANTKANININKEYADRLNSMTASGQKIVRPSDDPVIAIRAMRLNTTIDELSQYHGKNIPDADAWYTDTETALSQADDVLSNIREKLNQASSEENVTSNVKDILEELKQLKAQYYALGNADCAGRTVFTGYRTSEMLTFKEDDKLKYEIKQTFDFSDIEPVTYFKGTKDVDIAKGAGLDYLETDITSETYYRIRLPYSDISTDSASVVIKRANGSAIVDTSGGIVDSIAGKTPQQLDDMYLNKPANQLRIIKETGEIVISKELYDHLVKNGAESFEVTYQKEDWQKGDPRPEHYFQCSTVVDENDPRTYETVTKADGTIEKRSIEYNYNRVDAQGNPTKDREGTEIRGFMEQELNYEIAFNQTIQINTNASGVFSHDIGRDIDDLISITQEVIAAENKLASVKEAYENETDGTAKKEQYKAVLAAVEKQHTLLKSKMHDMYTGAITKFRGHSETVNNEISRIGALTSRLELTKNRIKDQSNNVKKIADSNINADLAETAIDYKSAQLALEAAQMAAGKIANQTLLNYI